MNNIQKSQNKNQKKSLYATGISCDEIDDPDDVVDELGVSSNSPLIGVTPCRATQFFISRYDFTDLGNVNDPR